MTFGSGGQHSIQLSYGHVLLSILIDQPHYVKRKRFIISLVCDNVIP